MRKLTINASTEYCVTINDDLSLVKDAIAAFDSEKVAVITDDNVFALYPNVLDGFFVGKKVRTIIVENGENSKSAENFIMILNTLAELGFTRKDAVVAFGGGVVGDLAAFCASTYMRGIKLFSVPTTLLAAVDSSVGGKTAINLDKGKNLCGTFYQPSAVYVCTGFLKTLPEKQVLCGYGEIIKYAFLSDSIKRSDIISADTEELIYKCLKIKKRIVEKDERESGERKLLNLGHTFGHAIERLCGFSLSHGECVVKGLAIILGVSAKYYGFTKKEYDRAYEIISCKGHDLSVKYSAEELLEAVKSDKKSDGSGVDAVLIDKNTSARIVRLSFAELMDLLQ